MVQIGASCVDAYEASLETLVGGRWAPWPPFRGPGGARARAVSRAGVIPQAYISGYEAEAACKASGKRLCSASEWTRACRGAADTRYPYSSNERRDGWCNDNGSSAVSILFPSRKGQARIFAIELLDPRLNQFPRTVARTGSFPRCASRGAFDMVGNVNEWLSDPDGTFAGGFYLSSLSKHGLGCQDWTVAHSRAYRDYTTGVRCCADAR